MAAVVVVCDHCGTHVRISDPAKVETGGHYVCGKCKEPVRIPEQGKSTVNYQPPEDDVIRIKLKPDDFFLIKRAVVNCKHCGARVRISDRGRTQTGGYYVCGRCKKPVRIPEQVRQRDIRDILETAVVYNHVLKITYTSSKRVSIERLIEVHQVGPRYFDAFDFKSSQFQAFRIDRVIKIERTTDNFNRRLDYHSSPWISPPYPRYAYHVDR